MIILTLSIPLCAVAGGSIPHSFQNAQKQQYLTNYMWYVHEYSN